MGEEEELGFRPTEAEISNVQDGCGLPLVSQLQPTCWLCGKCPRLLAHPDPAGEPDRSLGASSPLPKRLSSFALARSFSNGPISS